MKRRILFAAGILILAALLLLYAFINPASNSKFPPCPFYYVTGIFCPGCGSQRALHQLLNGHIHQAADLNILLVIFTPILSVAFITAIINHFNKKEIFSFTLLNKVWFIKTTAVVIMLFWIIRNTDTVVGKFLAP